MTLDGGVADAILKHARQAAPHECCGLLLGTAAAIVEALPARNIADDPTRRYLVDPHDYLTAIRTARARAVEVVGAYHSHPQSRAIPSATDTAEAFSDFLFVIVGLGPDPPEISGWRWIGGNFTRVTLVRLG